jgi:replicative DNA helicase
MGHNQLTTSLIFVMKADLSWKSIPMNQKTHKASSATKKPPSEVGFEKYLLGAALCATLYDASMASCIVEMLTRDDLFLHSHRLIFDKIKSLLEEGAPVSVPSVASSLSQAGELQKVGGVSYLSDLENSANKRLDQTEIMYYAGKLKKKALLRQLAALGNDIYIKAFNEEDDANKLLEMLHDSLARISEQEATRSHPIFQSFGEFSKQKFGAGEDILLHTKRRELGLIAAITNRGKSTLLRNLLLTIAVGSEFKPFIEQDKPRRVLLADFESGSIRLQADLNQMTADWSHSKIDLVRENLIISCESMVGDDLFNLSSHMRILEREAFMHKVDLIAIDTASAAFDLRDENNNSEVARLALKPLLKLARKVDCGVWLMHHIGKGSGEEAKAIEKAYKARGASAFGCYPATVFVLTATPGNPNLVTVACGKRKDGEEYERVVQLNRQSRWFEQTDETPPPAAPTSREIVRAVITHEMQKAEIVIALKDSRLGLKTIENALSKDVAEGFLSSPKRGWYTPMEVLPSATPLGNCGDTESKSNETT